METAVGVYPSAYINAWHRCVPSQGGTHYVLSYIYKNWRRLLLLLFVPEVIPRYQKGKDEVFRFLCLSF